MKAALPYIVVTNWMALLFVVAHYSVVKKRLRKRIQKHHLTYALSLALYCTAWTFYGSIGNAVSGGWTFIGVYLGPTLIAPFLSILLIKMIRISKHLRITSIADFLSSRYGKSSNMGAVVALFCMLVVIPYISIQLKAMSFSTQFLAVEGINEIKLTHQHFYTDPAFFFAVAFAIFSAVFGTIRLDPNEKHPGLVNAIAFESIVKIVAFVVASLVIIYAFSKEDGHWLEAMSPELISSINNEALGWPKWTTIAFLSAIAFLLLPRQFHIAVVENRTEEQVYPSTWIIPLYLFIISILVIPIAYVGMSVMPEYIDADTYLLSLPLHYGFLFIALLVYLGGIAAAGGMMIVSLLALSIMISNNLVVPLILNYRTQYDYFLSNLNQRLLEIRRVIIFLVALLSYGFYQLITVHYSLVSVGLISFAGIAQLAPIFFLGLFWKKASRKGALIGLTAGILIWTYMLPFTQLVQAGYFSSRILNHGPWGIYWLSPENFLGLGVYDPITACTIVSLSINTLLFVLFSLISPPKESEISQADIFTSPEKYLQFRPSQLSPVRRSSDFSAMDVVLKNILRPEQVNQLYATYFGKWPLTETPKTTPSDLVDIVENHLTGAVGAASTKIILRYLVKDEPIQMDDLINMLDQTQKVIQYSNELQSKTQALDASTRELRLANQRLLDLDILKNEFISNVTHELRTPLTSIQSLSQILMTYPVSEEEQERFVKIIHDEAVRVGQLVNQVLDYRKMDVIEEVQWSRWEVVELFNEIRDSVTALLENRILEFKHEIEDIRVDKNMLKHILLNLVSNALKFTDARGGQIRVVLEDSSTHYKMSVADNGIGISEEALPHIFDRFYQVQKAQLDKPKGSGLGLAICKRYIEKMDGTITVKSRQGEGSTFTLEWPKENSEKND